MDLGEISPEGKRYLEDITSLIVGFLRGAAVLVEGQEMGRNNLT